MADITPKRPNAARRRRKHGDAATAPAVKADQPPAKERWQPSPAPRFKAASQADERGALKLVPVDDDGEFIYRLSKAFGVEPRRPATCQSSYGLVRASASAIPIICTLSTPPFR